ncbi:MAG TPA: hypothetical protein VNV17_04725 [Solirubrobacteraceae bacterium]|jgi:hypothetical protein|nr:hypothetical protein [Solirubrobacteraceae bacterium]
MSTAVVAVSGELAMVAGHGAARELALQDVRDASQWGAADPEVVAATATRIAAGDPDAWLREWTGAGGEAWAAAGRRADAAQYLHAASYYAAALAVIADTDGSVNEARLWDRQRVCWDRAAQALGGERVAVPYEGTSLPGYFFSSGRGRRPLVVVDAGGRAPTSQAWARAGAAAQAHGYHWMTFDAPGRQAALRRQGLVLRPDWEAVLGPVADAMTARDDVDASRMAVIGCELAAFGVIRALAYEHRFAAAVVTPGVVDASSPWMGALPAPARAALRDRDRAAFDTELHLADLFAPDTSQRLRRGTRCFDLADTGLYDVYQRIRTFRLGPEADRVTTSVLVSADRADRLWPGQSAALHERLGDRSVLRGDADAGGPDAIMRWVDGRL